MDLNIKNLFASMTAEKKRKIEFIFEIWLINRLQ